MSDHLDTDYTPRDIVIKGNKRIDITPNVNFNGETGVCSISGESHHQNEREFYLPLIKWVREYTRTKKPIEFNFKLTYFSTSSSKQIMTILEVLKNYEDNDGKVTVNWYYPEDDEEIFEEAEDYMQAIGIKLNLIVLK